MSNLILAFIVGVLAGAGYMYLRYHKMMEKHLRDLEQLKLRGAEIDGQMKILNIINGVKEPANENQEIR